MVGYRPFFLKATMSCIRSCSPVSFWDSPEFSYPKDFLEDSKLFPDEVSVSSYSISASPVPENPSVQKTVEAASVLSSSSKKESAGPFSETLVSSAQAETSAVTKPKNKKFKSHCDVSSFPEQPASEESSFIKEGTPSFDDLLSQASAYRMMQRVFYANQHKLKMSLSTFKKRVKVWKKAHPLPLNPVIERCVLQEMAKEAIQTKNTRQVYERWKDVVPITYHALAKEVWLERAIQDPFSFPDVPYYLSVEEIGRLPTQELKEKAVQFVRKQREAQISKKPLKKRKNKA